MEKIKNILEELLIDIDLLEINHYKEALKQFNMAYEYERLFGGIPDVETILDINGEIVEEYNFINVKCDKATKDYFAGVNNIIEELFWDLMTMEEALQDLHNLPTSEKIDNFFSYNSIKIKNDILKKAIKLNNSINQPFIKLRKLEEIQYKKLIDAEDFIALYGKSKNTQLSYRSRSRNPMPYLGGGKGKDLMYNKEAVEKWFENHL